MTVRCDSEAPPNLRPPAEDGARTIFSAAAASAATVAVAVVAAAAVSAAEPKRVGGTDIWGGYRAGDGKKRVCFVHGAPEQSRGKYKRRGKTYLQVTHRPGEKERDVASLTAGYVYKKGSEVQIDIDGNKFALFTHGDTAWAKDEKTDRAIVKALIRSGKMTVRGRSTRNTLTTDTYSLTGFTRAYRAASKACKIRPL